MTKFRKLIVVLLVAAMCSLSATACKSGGKNTDHPQGEHPKGDHPKH